MEKMIDPSKLTVENCLKGKKYFIDFYQREYVWTKETIETLLKDICWTFENSYAEYGDAELSPQVMAKYAWYYLNVFITNNVDEKIFVVDGQQRLTSLTLIAAYLFHRVRNETLRDVLKNCIYSSDRYAGNLYNIDHEKRHRMMDVIFNSDGEGWEGEFNCVTEATLLERYRDVKSFFERKAFDEKKLYVFANYFLERLVLVELSIEKENTAMVFEVINDRGEPLKRFEILKGKLIGTLPKDDTEYYSAIWQEAMNNVKGIEDDFFLDLLKCRFMTTNNSSMVSALSSAYHRYMFESDNPIANGLCFRRQDADHVANIKSFIKQDVAYYAKLYGKIRANANDYLKYDNDINQLTNQYQNILAACTLNDSEEDAKVEKIAREFDRMYMVLRLNGVYNSNSFQDLAYELNGLLKALPISDYRATFDTLIERFICQRLGVPRLDSLLEYGRFNQQRYTNFETRPLRYLFARVDKYICDGIGENMLASVYDIVKKTGARTGFHIEHILSRNEESQSKFVSEEEFDDQRNRLGGLLLLRGLNNISSGNELYQDKLRTYSNGPYWGRTLVPETYHANVPFREFNESFVAAHGIGFEAITDFDKNALEKRCRLLFEIVKAIWDV